MNRRKSNERSKTDRSKPDDRHNFGNDYNNHYLHSGSFPQAYITNADNPLVGYPKLQLLHELKQKQNLKYSHLPFGARVKPHDQPKFLEGLNKMVFDIIMVGSCLDNDQPSLQMLMDLQIGKISPRPSVLFLWVSSSMLDQGRQAMEYWGFRRSEDIVYFTMSKDCVHFPKHDGGVTQKSTWHCLMGLKGTLRRSEDYDLINCNVDTDLLFDNANSRKHPGVVPHGTYSLIENFCLMSRRIHIIPSRTTIDKPVYPRPGWVVVSPDIYLDNFDPRVYQAELDKLPPNNRVPLTTEIEQLRPKTPPPVGGTGKDRMPNSTRKAGMR